MIRKRHNLVTYHLIRYYGRILFLCILISITWNLSTFSYTSSVPSTSSTDTTTSEVGLRSQVFTPDITLESLFAPAENFLPPALFDSETNSFYCPDAKCRFMFIYHSNEREAEAQQHFQMFAQLASKLDRTIVLPNVERKQIGTCKKYAFNYYYSIESLKAMYPDVKFMLQEEFKRWTKERYLKPSVRKIIISDGRYKGKNSAERYCLDEFNLNYNALESNLIIIKGKRRNAADLQKEVIKISTNDTVSNIEVLLFEHSSRRVIFPQETHTSINYSEFIINEVTNMVSKLTPYIAIHWQMERGNPESMPKCAEKLALKANDLKLRHNISSVYLATDYPLKSNLEISTSFRNITSSHHKAIRILRRKTSFESFSSFEIKNRWGDIVKWKKLTDTGLPEILDKLMCIRAKFLLTMPSECKGGQKNDNYADIIIKERKKLLEIEAGEQDIIEDD